MNLDLNSQDLAACVSCGLCLPHCPTYRVTGLDTASPRGRISLMQALQDGTAEPEPEVVESLRTCVQCMGCETACPSGVPFGELIGQTRTELASQGLITPWWQRAAMAVLGHHRTLLFGSSLLAVAQRLRVVPSARLGLPARLPIRRERLESSGEDVWLFTGCVMDAWQRPTHAAVQRVLEAAGLGVKPTGGLAPCCGALHAHAGLEAQARRLAAAVIGDLDGTGPVLVDSAGCGAALKHVGELVGTAEAVALSKRVFDVHEWMVDRLDDLPTPDAPLDLTVAVADPCHLRHVQRTHMEVRTLLAPFVREIVELDDDGLCCGAGGAYAVLEPDLAGSIRERKVAAIARSGADVVASANPGCSMHLAAAGIEAVHPFELIDRCLNATPPGGVA